MAHRSFHLARGRVAAVGVWAVIGLAVYLAAGRTSLAQDQSPEAPAISWSKKVIDNTVDRTHVALGADLDGDNDMDVVATDYVDHDLYWYQNTGNLNFTRKVVDANLQGATMHPVGHSSWWWMLPIRCASPHGGRSARVAQWASGPAPTSCGSRALPASRSRSGCSTRCPNRRR